MGIVRKAESQHVTNMDILTLDLNHVLGIALHARWNTQHTSILRSLLAPRKGRPPERDPRGDPWGEPSFDKWVWV